MIDLDHNAGTPLRPQARAAMLEALDAGGNASSIHGRGRSAKRLLERARETLAEQLGVGPSNVVLTSGGTEANALALHGRRTLASAVEHPAVLAQPGVLADRLPVDHDGRVRVDVAADLIRQTGADTVAVMAANNETGVLQPLAELRAVLPEGVALHVDAVQAPGRLEVPALAALADTLALSAHKLGGPPGAGALVLGRDREVSPLLVGGGQERGRRGGTENVPAVVGFAAALQAIDPGEADRLLALRRQLEQGVEQFDDAVIVARDAPRLCNTVAVAFPGRAAATLVMALDLEGVAISSGAACSSGRVARSHVLAAMGLADDIVTSTVRISLGWTSTAADVATALDALRRVLGRRRAAPPAAA
ncbi:MAG: cysteine desulfurase family protein [Pseudomonadota bacterium]